MITWGTPYFRKRPYRISIEYIMFRISIMEHPHIQDVPIYPHPHCTFIISTAARLTSPSFLDLHPGCLEGHFTSDFIKNMSVSVCISLCVFIIHEEPTCFSRMGKNGQETKEFHPQMGLESNYVGKRFQKPCGGVGRHFMAKTQPRTHGSVGSNLFCGGLWNRQPDIRDSFKKSIESKGCPV